MGFANVRAGTRVLMLVLVQVRVTDEQYDEYRAHFSRFDADGSGPSCRRGVFGYPPEH